MSFAHAAAAAGAGTSCHSALRLLILFWSISVPFGTFWERLGKPFSTQLRPILGSGPVLEAFGGHVGGILVPFGRLSVSTSFLDPQND